MPFFSKTSLISGCITTFLITSVVKAQEQDAIIVTATRTAQTVDESLASVTVITRDDIENSQSKDLFGLLNSYPGMILSRNGGPGTTTNLFLRGTNSDHTLVLIDGVRAGSATTGAFAWNNLPTSEIEKIEIVRGPLATQYGSDAIGGVVHIFTRKNKKKYLQLQYGSYNSKLVGIGLGGGTQANYSINATYQGTDGFSATNSKSTNFNSDDDGFRSQSLSANIAVPFSKQTSFSIAALHSNNKTDYDQGINDLTNSTLNLTLSGITSDNWTQTFSLGLANDKIDDTSSFPSKITTQRVMADWQHDVSISDSHLLTLGLSTRTDKGENINKSSNTTVFNQSIDNNALFMTLQSNIAQQDILLSTRVDDHTQVGSHSTYQLSWGYNFNKGLRLIASYGTAFRAPNLNELYHPGFGGFFAGNPNLLPEDSQNSEIGLRTGWGSNHKLSVNYYNNDIDNLIAYEGTNSQAININSTHIDGVEAEYQYRTQYWLINANITLQRAIDKSDNSDLIRRPREKAAIKLTRCLQNKSSYSVEWIYNAARKDSDFSTSPATSVTLSDYQVFNASGRYQISKRFWLEGRLENILDEQYELVYGYNTSGRSVFAGITYNLG